MYLFILKQILIVVNILEKNESMLAIEVKDSVILRKLSEVKGATTKTSFSISPKDSLELKLEANLGIKKTQSKLITARDSVELVKESINRLAVNECKGVKKQMRKASTGTSPRRGSMILNCCDKCTKNSFEIMDTILVKTNSTEESPMKFKKTSDSSRPLQFSHIEFIKAADFNESQVMFDNVPQMVGNTTKVAEFYKTEEEPPKGMKLCIIDMLNASLKSIYSFLAVNKSRAKDKFLKKPPTTAVIGNQDSKEYLQTPKEFSDDRIHSFVSLIKDHPDLLRLFTACRR